MELGAGVKPQGPPPPRPFAAANVPIPRAKFRNLKTTRLPHDTMRGQCTLCIFVAAVVYLFVTGVVLQPTRIVDALETAVDATSAVMTGISDYLDSASDGAEAGERLRSASLSTSRVSADSVDGDDLDEGENTTDGSTASRTIKRHVGAVESMRRHVSTAYRQQKARRAAQIRLEAKKSVVQQKEVLKRKARGGPPTPTVPKGGRISQSVATNEGNDYLAARERAARNASGSGMTAPRATWDEHGNIPLREAIVSTRCDIEKRDAATLSREEFEATYLQKRPVVLVRPTDAREFTAMVQRAALLERYGEEIITLSTANKNSYNKIEVTVREYVETMMPPTSLDARGNLSWYHFGHNRQGEWHELFRFYEKPMKYIYGPHATLSFGIAGSGSGVPFHTHGHVFAEVLFGRKRWFLQAPGPQPRFDPDATSLDWVVNVKPTLLPDEEKLILDCTVAPGEMLYIPALWHHSTLNVGETVFMSTFV